MTPNNLEPDSLVFLMILALTTLPYFLNSVCRSDAFALDDKPLTQTILSFDDDEPLESGK